jgi:F420-dependent oxidoreductase-like protein
MRIGLFISDVSGEQTTVEQLLTNVRAAEALGFTTGWVPHIPWSLDGLTALALAGTVTNRIELGTAVMPTYPRHPMAMAQQAMSTQAATNGRLALGIGPSHPVVIESMFGLEYDRPARHTREYVEVLRAAFAGAGHVEYRGDFFAFSSMLTVPGSTPAPILVAALAPRMLQLAGEVADGTITYWANERALGEHIVPGITEAAAAVERPAPRVVVGLPVAVCADRDAGRERAAKLFATYLNIPTYQRILARGGDSTTPADVAIIGTEAEVTARLQAYAAAGATDLCATALGLDDDRDASQRRTVELLASLAPELESQEHA